MEFTLATKQHALWHACRTCESDIIEGQPIGVDLHEEGITVRCWGCYAELQQVACDTWLSAADLARSHGYSVMAADCLRRAKAIAVEMDTQEAGRVTSTKSLAFERALRS